LNWHGKHLEHESAPAIAHLKTLIKNPDTKIEPKKPEIEEYKEIAHEPIKIGDLNYEKGKAVATRNAYGTALVKLGKNDVNKVIVGIDGDTKNSTMAE